MRRISETSTLYVIEILRRSAPLNDNSFFNSNKKSDAK